MPSMLQTILWGNGKTVLPHNGACQATAARTKASAVACLSTNRIVSSNAIRSMAVCLRVLCVCCPVQTEVLWLAVQGFLRNVHQQNVETRTLDHTGLTCHQEDSEQPIVMQLRSRWRTLGHSLYVSIPHTYTKNMVDARTCKVGAATASFNLG
jgi:hypothetical protein